MNAATSATGTNLVIRTTMRSDVGRVRSENQDAGAIAADNGTRLAGHLMVVADGMGGYRGGATASRMAVSIVKTAYLEGSNPNLDEVLREAITRANQAIHSEAQTNADLQKMGTTCSVLVIRGNEAHIAHVGDSRVYLVRDGAIKQLTEDHSLVATMVREGLLTSSEAEVHPRRNVLHRAVGVSPELEVDLLPPFRIQPGDCFVLCSDGLHGVVKADEIRELSALPIEKAADEMIDRALARGAPDNVTVILARVEEPTQ